MSNEVTKIQMRSANNRPQKMSLEFLHHGTSDFFKPQVIHCQEVRPGETVKLHTQVNIKGKPMMMPGEIQIKHHISAFWVPNFATHPDWFAFRTNLPFELNSSYAKHENDYWFYNCQLVQLFFYHDSKTQYIKDHPLQINWSTTAINPDTQQTKYDISLSLWDGDAQGNNTFKGVLQFNLTNQGRILYNLLQQLGYEINWQVCNNNTLSQIDWQDKTTIWEGIFTHDGYQGFDLFNLSGANSGALPIAARPLIQFMKIMLDYYIPPQYENNFSKMFTNILKNEHIMTIPNTYSPTIGNLIIELASWVNYNIDRFTGAWKTPQGPNDSTTDFKLKDITNQGTGDAVGSIWESGTDKTPIIKSSINGNQATQNFGITDYILRALDAIQNFTTRNRIAGYRPIDRFLAHFGKRLDYIHTKRAQYIDGNTNNLAIIDVTSTAEAAGVTPGGTGLNDAKLLGGQAAKANGSITIDVNWTADDDGWIFIIDTIVPRNGYYQGIKNHCLRVNWRDMYNPEFDNLGTQPIRRIELFHNSEGSGTILNQEQIWGYEPTYMGMKTGWDIKSGDRRLRTLNAGLDSMDTLRTFKADGSDLPQSNQSSFLRGENAQYDRIFQYMFGDVDHYYFNALTRDEGTKPMKSISESLPLTDGEGSTTEWQYGGGNYMQ